MNLGKSFIDFGSTATVTTGSEICLIASKGGASFSLAIVTQTAALCKIGNTPKILKKYNFGIFLGLSWNTQKILQK
ncbi:MAG TPA: hypothetical protein D7H80_05540 [Candidatus Poseidoniales archaeon]|nr:MAG TPA: hypothetical protein D7H80_05540 [Candidatus Poseidoniales archaeon]